MNDTPVHIHRKQLEIILSKPMNERLLMGLQMMEDGREFMLNRIKRQNPGISEVETKIEFIRQYYKDDLTEQYLENVAKSIRKKSQVS